MTAPELPPTGTVPACGPADPSDSPRETVSLAAADLRAQADPAADDLGMELDESATSPAEPGTGMVVPSAGPTPTWSPSTFVADPMVTESPMPPPQLSASFGKYELLGEVGRGGMGVVYKARHKELGRVVAIKMILASHLASREQVERFYVEARAAARIRSPNIVGIHDVGQIHGQHYFAMDYVDGPSLAQELRHGPLEPSQAARHVLIVARAVAELHALGIVHRDLKPSNVLLDRSGRPCLTDFGLAKMLGADAPVTRTGAIVGTPGYMAPEQASGKAESISPLCDVYSLGAILFELLTGRPPFQGESPLDTLVQVLEGEPPRPGHLRAGLPRPLEQICLKCLEREPSDRYRSAAALADDLERFLHGEGIAARDVGPWAHLRRWARRRPALASRLGTMGLCGAIIQTNHYLIQPLEPWSHRRAIALVVAWALASVAFQSLLDRDRWANVARYAWAAADVILYTLLVLLYNGLTTSLVSGYFLLVAASGLWFRERVVMVTTGMAVVGYGMLVLEAGLFAASIDSPYHHIVFATALAASGLITGYQVKRVRALSQYYENRPLP